MAGRACKDTTKRLLKCFCGCTEITEDEVQRIYRLSAQATLIDRVAANMLHQYLLRNRCSAEDKCLAEQFLDVYEQCGAYLQEDSILTLDELDELVDKGLPYALEKDLKHQIQTGDRSNIERGLLRIQGEMRNEIEATKEYANYKQAVLDKLKHRM